jgi:NAD(P)-dependent dehydrogenase (short-subunit alcohol dehydrogenase family)
MNPSTIVVIGGLSGIGRAVAERAAATGARVIAAGRRAAPAGFPARIETAQLDIGDEDAVRSFFTALGPVDHVVVTAGPVIPSRRLAELDIAAAQQAFDTKVFGQLRVARHAQLAPGGSITLTSGLLARKAVPGGLVKSAMNAAVEAIGKTLAKELAPVRVNVVSPGMVETGMWGPLPEAERQAMAQRTGAGLPVGRVGQPDDLAAAYLMVLDNGFMTGAVIDVDGGGLL